MIFRVTMKTPDALIRSVDEAVHQELVNRRRDGADCDEDVRDNLADAANAVALKWFRYGEQLTVEIDTDKDTCLVVQTGH